MAINVNKVLNLMTEASVPVEQRAKVLSIAMARAIGYSLAMPTSKVELPLSHYAMQEKSMVDQVVSEINEIYPIDVEKTCSLIQAFWLFRYRVIYDVNNTAVREFMDGLVKCGSREFPGYVSEFMIELKDDWMLDRVAAMLREDIFT